tara:strand:+ start:520 stop:1311 length:792 start_codon:yes stop_codon:yes gene_type:complete
MKKLFRNLLPGKIYQLLKIAYRSINPQKRITNEDSLEFNEKLLQKYGMDIEKIKLALKVGGQNYNNNSLSWHYHLFAGMGHIFKQKNDSIKNVLEIGTADGSFTNFISKVYPDAEIFTIDLPSDDKIFNSTYGREKDKFKEIFLNSRKENISASNINFIEMDSTKLLNKFKDKIFDLVWIDGDHHNPQVTIDIMNTLHLLNKNSVVCVDDIVMEQYRTDYVSNESFLTLKKLEQNKILNNNFVIKKTYANQKTIKYVSFSSIL